MCKGSEGEVDEPQEGGEQHGQRERDGYEPEGQRLAPNSPQQIHYRPKKDAIKQDIRDKGVGDRGIFRAQNSPATRWRAAAGTIHEDGQWPPGALLSDTTSPARAGHSRGGIAGAIAVTRSDIAQRRNCQADCEDGIHDTEDAACATQWKRLQGFHAISAWRAARG